MASKKKGGGKSKEPEAPEILEGTYVFPDGSTYTGQYIKCRDGDDSLVRHGTGTMTFLDGSTYTGNWQQDKMHGQGRYAFQDQTVYEGGFEAGKYSGHGKMTLPSGAVVDGSWRENHPIENSVSFTDENSRRWQGQLTVDDAKTLSSGTLKPLLA